MRKTLVGSLARMPKGVIVPMVSSPVLGFAAGTRRAMKTSAQFDSHPDNDDRR